MSLVNLTIIGAIWSVASRLGSRVISLVASLLITRFLPPGVVGEVGNAVVAVQIANLFSDVAFSQYVVIRSQDRPGATFHAFIYNLMGLVTAAIVMVLLASPLDMARYLPIMALAFVFERLSRIPESVAMRELRFKLFSVITSVTEIVYACISLGLAAAGYGGDAIVWANVAQYSLRFLWFSLAIPRKYWLTPVAITRKQSKELFRFGIPLAIGNIAGAGTRAVVDRVIVTKLFGAASHGQYAYAKNLSAVPADNIGDAVADVLTPSFVQMTVEEARVAVVRACHFISLFVIPLAAGLAVVAPLLVQALFPPLWHGVALPLTILAAFSVIDPIGDTVAAYLKARNYVRQLMYAQLAYVVMIIPTTFGLAVQFGLYGACVGVGLGVAFRALTLLALASYLDRVSALDMLIGICRTLAASGLMVLSVLIIRILFTSSLESIPLALVVEIIIGALAYPAAALLTSFPIVRDVSRWIRGHRSPPAN